MEKSVQQIPGVVCADLNFATGLLVLDYDPVADPRDAVVKAVRASGHGMQLVEREGVAATPVAGWHERRHETALGVSGVLILFGWVLGLVHAPWVPTAQVVAFGGAVLVGGTLTARRAVASLRARSLDMNVLMSLAVIGALSIGLFEEAASVIFLFSIGQYLESRALERTRRSIRDLMNLAPPMARVRRDGREAEIAPSEVHVGDLVVVKPGERIALDGVVLKGTSAVDESPITGESVPSEKEPGSPVFAGTLNASGLLEVEVTSLAADSTLARVVYMVEEAQAQRAPMQQLVDRFTRYYTPAVVALAVAVALVPPLAGLGTWSEWFYRALVVLVVSCPCALVISTPVAIVSAITRATRDGLLVKGGAFLEAAAVVRVVALDKTGTLTCGRPEVSDVVPLGDGDASRVLRLAAALEVGSTHPLAEAILRAEGAPESVGHLSDFADEAGLGVRAKIDGVTYALGSPSFASASGALDAEASEKARQLESEGKTVLVLARDKSAVGLIAVADTVRPESPAVVSALRDLGIEHVVMLTGDNERTAASVSAHAGLTEYRARLLPEQKLDAVRELREAYGAVAMVGDGVNDAPALAVADVGIAMGAAGSDTVLETADVALMADDLRVLPGLFALGRRTVSTVRANVVFSIVIKFVVLIAAVFGYASLWLAVFADVGVSLLVTLNGLRLLGGRTALPPGEAGCAEPASK